MSDNTVRLPIHEYALRLAEVAALRSQDPDRKVGAVALSPDNRVVATAYNGVAPNFEPSGCFWTNREHRVPYMIHAEQNLCSLFKRGDVDKVAVTLAPCSACMRLLIAHGVKVIWYREEYERDQLGIDVARFYGVNLVKVMNGYVIDILSVEANVHKCVNVSEDRTDTMRLNFLSQEPQS